MKRLFTIDEIHKIIESKGCINLFLETANSQLKNSSIFIKINISNHIFYHIEYLLT